MSKSDNTAAKKGGRKKVMGERPEGAGRPVLYPDMILVSYCGDGSQKVKVENRPAITAEKMKEYLGWQSEPEFIASQQKIDPSFDGKLPEIGHQISYVHPETGVEYTATVLLKDEEGHKVVCWNIAGNRPFDESRCRKYMQDMANRQWAGPTTIVGETYNGETLIIGKTGKVESGQKRGVALVLLWQKWKKHVETNGYLSVLWPKEKYPKGPVLDVPIFFGISEAPTVIRTLDEVQTRSTEDTLYSSPVFDALPSDKRREACKSASKAIKILWDRMCAGKGDTRYKYKTHSEELDFLDRHPRVRKCVLHLQKCNGKETRNITLKLGGMSTGECAGLMYLMAHGDSDVNDYRNAEPRPKESVLDCGLLDKAEQFWLDIGKGEGGGEVIANVVARRTDTLYGPIAQQKYAVLAKAWSLYVDDQPIDEESIDLTDDDFQTDENGKMSLSSPYTFNHGDMGIDLGPSLRKKEKQVQDDEEAIQKAIEAKEEERRKAIEEQEARLKGLKGKGGKKPPKNGVKPSTHDFNEWQPPVDGEQPSAESEPSVEGEPIISDDGEPVIEEESPSGAEG